MNRLSLIFSFASLLSINALANTQLKVHSGPATVSWETDRYSSQATLELVYRGYLVDCQSPEGGRKAITAHLIFHSGNETEIFRHVLFLQCKPSFFTRETNIGLFRSGEYEPTHRRLWQFLNRSRFGGVRFQLAFERDGFWDSDYGQNFDVHF